MCTEWVLNKWDGGCTMESCGSGKGLVAGSRGHDVPQKAANFLTNSATIGLSIRILLHLFFLYGTPAHFGPWPPL
jgi:hypothetical protein